MSDPISRAEAIGIIEAAISDEHISARASLYMARAELTALPSAVCDDCIWHVCNYNKVDWDADVADSDDLIIKGAKGIQDGLYNIKDGKLFQYKAKGGTVRTYEIVPSAEAEWIPCSKRLPENTAEWKAYITCNESGAISTTYWADGWNCSRNSDGEINREHELKNIVAWMPLPEPWKGADDE